MAQLILVAILAYFIGNISPSFLLGKFFVKKDIRNFGSGSAGTTNAIRVFGAKIGLITFLLDIFKGILAAFLGSKIEPVLGMYVGSFFVIMGHNWPVLLKFKGGKGIASSLGIYLFLDPVAAAISAVIAITIIAITRYVSLASLIGSTLIFLLVLFFRFSNTPFLVVTFLLALMAFYRHRANIKRLIKGTEPKLGQKAKEKY